MTLDDKITFICAGNVPERSEYICEYKKHYNSISCTYNDYDICKKKYGNPCVEVTLWDLKHNATRLKYK